MRHRADVKKKLEDESAPTLLRRQRCLKFEYAVVCNRGFQPWLAAIRSGGRPIVLQWVAANSCCDKLRQDVPVTSGRDCPKKGARPYGRAPRDCVWWVELVQVIARVGHRILTRLRTSESDRLWWDSGRFEWLARLIWEPSWRRSSLGIVLQR